MTTTAEPSAPTSTPTRLEAIAALRAQRDEMLQELSRLTEEECRYPAQWANVQRSVNFLLRAFSLHEIDHLQHAQRLLRARGIHLSEAQLLLSKAQALRGEMEALLMALSDEQFDASGPGEGDWSVRQLVDHLRNTDRGYLNNVRGAVEAGRGNSQT